VELRSSDTVIIASPVAPGTEHDATVMINELYKENVNVEELSASSVMAVHPSSDDLKLMLYLLKPKYFLPILGEYRHFMTAANMALESGYTPDKIILLDNGQIAKFKDGNLVSCSTHYDVGETMIDGKDDLDITGFVLKDRETLSTDGVIVVGISLNFNTKEIIGGPDIQSRGVIYIKDSEYIIKGIGKIIQDVIKEKVADKTYDNNSARSEARERIARYVLKETGKRPMILPAIIELNAAAEGGRD
jgi:ribonuclease J